MNRKLVLSLVLALAIFTTVFCAGIPGQAQAINITPGGSNGKLFKQTSGTVTIGGITENGVEIVLDGSYTDNKFQFVQNMYMDGFAFEAQTNLYFDSFTLTVSDYSDADNVAEITVTKETQEGSKVFYGTVKTVILPASGPRFRLLPSIPKRLPTATSTVLPSLTKTAFSPLTA